MSKPDAAGSIIWSRSIQDVDGMAATLLNGFAGDSVQLAGGSFSAQVTEIQCGAFAIQFRRVNGATVHHFRVPADRWAIFVPISAGDPVRWDGRVVARGRQIVCPPSTESVVFDPGAVDTAIFSIDPTSAPALVSAMRTVVDNTSRVVMPSARRARPLVRLLAELRTIAEFKPDTISDEKLRHFELRIASGLFASLTGAVVSDGHIDAVRQRNHIVRQAETLALRANGQQISIADLSMMVDVSERGLRDTFYRVCNLSPKQYLRIRQLHQVRHALRASDRATVTSVATSSGFVELGRFAGEYRALFGETPSETLQTARLARHETEISPTKSALRRPSTPARLCKPA